MATFNFNLIFLTFLFLHSLVHSIVQAQTADKPSLNLITDVATTTEWPNAISIYSDLFDDDGEGEESAMDGGFNRRSLFWHTMRYYISYGALSADRIPCPPRSGRSYYSHNCFKAIGPVHPYTRACSRITRCRR